MAKRNGYELTRKWFDFAFEKKEAKSFHTAMFCWLVELNNRMGWKEEFGLPTRDTMDGLKIGNRNTYHSILKDLQSWGFIKIVQEAKNQYQSMFVTICHTQNEQAVVSALDQALTKQRTSSGVGSVPIDKQVNNETSKQENYPPPRRERKPQTLKLKISSCSADAAAFVAWWVEKVGPEGVNPSENEKIQWQNEYIDLVDIDGKTKEQIVRAATFGRTDNFWRSQFMSPLKLRKKNKEGIKYVDVFLENLRSGDSTGKPSQQKINRVLKQD